MGANPDLPYGRVPLPGEWAERGACRDWPTHWWFPAGGGGSAYYGLAKETRENTETALRICRTRCPVIDECLAHAIRFRERGIWGGTIEREREVLRVRPRLRPHGTPARYQHDGCRCKSCTRANAEAMAKWREKTA